MDDNYAASPRATSPECDSKTVTGKNVHKRNKTDRLSYPTVWTYQELYTSVGKFVVN